MEAQTSYSSLLTALVKLQNDVAAVPREKRASEEHENAVAKVKEGEELVELCLDAMKEKAAFPVDEVKAYISSIKSVTLAINKLKKGKK